MKNKIWPFLGIILFVISVGVFQGFTHLDKILAEQVSIAWNDIYEKTQEDTVNTVATKEEYESKIIRNGISGNNLCTFACNVDWGEDVIPDMLEIFKEKDVKITFFVTGRWAENNKELLKEMYESGHEIQSHGYSHALCSDISSEKVKEEIQKTEDAIIDAICIKPNYFAPAAGDYDGRTVEISEELGYKMVLWSSDTIDWREGSYANVIVERIMSKPLDGAIILMHPKQETLKALPTLIEQINTKGYKIVPLYRMPV